MILELIITDFIRTSSSQEVLFGLGEDNIECENEK